MIPTRIRSTSNGVFVGFVHEQHQITAVYVAERDVEYSVKDE